jgi:CheY-like chemotaxis protein
MKILVVDDEQDLREAFTESLSALGFQTAEAASGRLAAERLGRESFDAILSDIRMPDGDGLYLLDRVRAKPGGPLFIFFSGYSDYSEEELFSRGADGFFTKPCRASEIRDFVRKSQQDVRERWSLPTKEPSYILRGTISEQTLGRGGVCVRKGADPLPPVGVWVRTELSGWSGAEPLRGVGRVVWVRTPWAGIAWARVEEPGLAKLAEYVGRAQPRAFIPRGE